MRRIILTIVACAALLAGGAVAVLAANGTVTVTANSPNCARDGGTATACATNYSVAPGHALTISSPVATTSSTSSTTSSTTNTTTTTTTSTSSGGIPKPPAFASWYWQIGGGALPSTTGSYPAAGSAKIWDTDLFADSNTSGIPTGPSPIVSSLLDSGKYPICYVEAGAYQTGFPDSSDFAAADYGNEASKYAVPGWRGEWYFDIRGFANYVAGNNSTLTGAAPDIAQGLAKRFAWCALEGQKAVEADDLDGYTNSNGWGLTQADAQGFERWIAYTVHSDHLGWFFKNDAADASEAVADGAQGDIVEECNYYSDPCGTQTKQGDATPFLNASLPVLNAEYTSDGETTASFCSADNAAGIWGALFDVNLDGATYEPCWTASGL